MTKLVLPPPRRIKAELEHLYLRREAIDKLIRNLEAYERMATPVAELRTRRIA